LSLQTALVRAGETATCTPHALNRERACPNSTSSSSIVGTTSWMLSARQISRMASM
jgi:hypothetical protein